MVTTFSDYDEPTAQQRFPNTTLENAEAQTAKLKRAVAYLAKHNIRAVAIGNKFKYQTGGAACLAAKRSV